MVAYRNAADDEYDQARLASRHAQIYDHSREQGRNIGWCDGMGSGNQLFTRASFHGKSKQRQQEDSPADPFVRLCGRSYLIEL
jgi:hypothetical protein